jgi:hypothetical protein
MSYSPNVTGLKQLLDDGIREGNITRSVFEAFFEENRFRAFRGKAGKPQKGNFKTASKAEQKSKPTESQKDLDKKAALRKILQGKFPEVLKETWKQTLSALKSSKELYSQWEDEFIVDGKADRDKITVALASYGLTASEVNATRAFFPKIQQA